MSDTRQRTAEEVAQLLGPLDVLRSDLEEFKQSARVFSADRPRLIDEYRQQWVAVMSGEVVVSADRFEDVMDELDNRSLPRSQALVRFIDENTRTMIL